MNSPEEMEHVLSPEEKKQLMFHMKGHRNEILGRLAGVTARCGTMYITKRLASFNIGSSQAFILAELLHKDGLSQDDIRCLMKMDKGTVTRALQHLENCGFIHRGQDQEDRRVIRVFVTKKAQDFEHELYSVLLDWNTAIAKGLTKEEREQAISLMNRIAENAEAVARLGCHTA